MSNLFCSSIGKKLVMSLSGLFLIVFLLVHLVANLMIFGGQESYNAMASFMDTNPLIRIMVPVLAAGFIIHIVYAFIVTLLNRGARPVNYAVQDLSKSSTWESRNMFVLGLIVLGLLLIHLWDFWAKMQLQHFIGGAASEDPYSLVVAKLSNPIFAAVYIVWVWALWFHLRHGFWSAFQTVGLNNQIWIKRWKCVAKLYALVIAIGFTLIPIFVMAITYLCNSCAAGACQ
ncbi:MAG: succinate dehydrogenase cytochrome b subunit [Rikenellaceae bacterium]